MVGHQRSPAMFKYLMIAIFCVIVIKTGARIIHHANPTAYSQAHIS
jgi:hypothetical protein